MRFFPGKTIQELTEYCRKLSNKEEFGELSSLSEDSDVDADGKEKAFHHPFELKDRGPIVMNIRVIYREFDSTGKKSKIQFISRIPSQFHQNQLAS